MHRPVTSRGARATRRLVLLLAAGAAVLAAPQAQASVAREPAAAAAATPRQVDATIRLPEGHLDALIVRGAGAGRRPVVVMATGLGGVFEDTAIRYARLFARRGITAVGFNYRNFGDSSGTPRRLVDMDRQRADWRSAIAYAKRLGGVDPRRMALWGTSLAGGHVLSLAAEYPALRGVVAQVPYLDPTVLDIPQERAVAIARLATQDIAARAAGRPPVTVPFVGRPGSIALMTEKGAVEFYERLAAAGTPRVNSTPAASGLAVAGYRPIVQARTSKVRAFIAVGKRDTVAPPAPARDLARDIGATLYEVDTNHFAVYTGRPFTQLSGAEARFLVQRLAP